ncbi:MAG: ATP synthase F1 subunit epsilon [Gemmiger sp.]|nr:ATP synthase F1 subunit epsilon [Gemmiger sp.]
METFSLKIVTPDGCIYDGQAERLFCRTIDGDVGILPRHSDYCTALGMGDAHVIMDGKAHHAACIGGMLSVMAGKVTLVATTWEWAEEIDRARAEASLARATTALKQTDADKRELDLAEARLKRALVRTSVAPKP